MDWFCSVGERAKGDPKACHPSYRDGVAIYCSYNKASSPARLLHSSTVSESSECTQKPSWAGGHVWKKRTELYAIHSSPQGWSGDDRACVPFKVHVRSKKKKKLSLWLLPASRAPSPRVVFQLGSN